MSWGYLLRLLAWGGLIVGFVWVTLEWFTRQAPVGPVVPEVPRQVSVNPAASVSGESGIFPYLNRFVNRPITFARENWVFIVEVLILANLGWGTLGRGLGVYDLVYAEAKWVRFLNGLTAGLLFGNLWFIAYLIAQDAIPWAVLTEPTLFPVPLETPRREEAEAVRKAGHFLLLTWVPVLVLVYLPGAIRYGFGIPGTDRYPAVGLGMLCSVLAATGIVFLAWRGSASTSAMLTDWRLWYAQMPGAAEGRINKPDYPLHLFATVSIFLPLLGLILAGAAALLGRVACPVWVVCLMLWLFNAGYGFVSFHFAGLQYVLLVLGIALILVCNGRHPYKLSFPKMGPEYSAARFREAPARLVAPPTAVPPIPLLKAEEVLARFCEDWQREHGPTSRPRFVVVAAAGGGVRSAVWTAAVLEGLEKHIGPRFGRHVRLMTGSSGGMVAAALYAAAQVRPFANPSLARAVGEDSLWPVIQTMVTQDIPALFLPFYRNWDRGRSLEAAWHRNIPAREKTDKPPYRTTFAELLQAERRGEAPSLIFSPLMVEDARRVLISNLDLGDLTVEQAPTLIDTEGNRPVHKRMELSRSAVEFFRLFPAAHPRFEVGTAARMSATFPYVSPGVSLPTDPPRRVVDAGYFDNYGVNLAALWLYRHREAVRRYCSGVLIIEVRGFPLEAEKTGFIDTEEGARTAAGPIITALTGFSTPAEALVNTRAAGAYFRNDQLLGILDAEFNGGRSDPFLVRVPLECPGAAALSWSLTTRDRRTIERHFESEDGGLAPRIAAAVRSLKAWFGPGGG